MPCMQMSDVKSVVPLNSVVEANQSGLIAEPLLDITPQVGSLSEGRGLQRVQFLPVLDKMFKKIPASVTAAPVARVAAFPGPPGLRRRGFDRLRERADFRAAGRGPR